MRSRFRQLDNPDFGVLDWTLGFAELQGARV